MTGTSFKRRKHRDSTCTNFLINVYDSAVERTVSAANVRAARPTPDRAVRLSLTDASTAFFLAFGDCDRRHRARSDGQTGQPKGRSAHCARLAVGQGVLFVAARDQRPSVVVIGKIGDDRGRHLSTI